MGRGEGFALAVCRQMADDSPDRYILDPTRYPRHNNPPRGARASEERLRQGRAAARRRHPEI